MKKIFSNKTKRIIALSLTLALSFSLYGCGSDDKKSSNENTTQEVSNTPICDDENLLIEEKDNKVVITSKDTSSIWYLDTYETTIIDVEISENVGIYTFTVSPKEEGFASIDVIGETAEHKVIYPISFEVDNDLNIVTTFNSFEFFQFEEDTGTTETTIDEDLNTIFNDAIATMGAGNYPDPYMIRPIDMSSSDDMLYVLGVEKVTGMEKGAVMEPMMSSVAFSLVVLKFDNADNANSAAQTLYDAAPQQKWVCVLPEGVFTKVVNDTYLIVLMGPLASIDALQ